MTSTFHVPSGASCPSKHLRCSDGSFHSPCSIDLDRAITSSKDGETSNLPIPAGGIPASCDHAIAILASPERRAVAILLYSIHLASTGYGCLGFFFFERPYLLLTTCSALAGEMPLPPDLLILSLSRAPECAVSA